MTVELRKNTATPRKSTIDSMMSSFTPPHPQRRSSSPRRSAHQLRKWAFGSRNSSSKKKQEDDDSDEEVLHHYQPIWQGVLAAMTWFTFTAVILWYHVLPEATEWWMQQQQQQQQQSVEHPGAVKSMSQHLPLDDYRRRLPGSYASVDEMNGRRHRFPSIDQRVRVYMSNWYTPPCATIDNANKQKALDASYVQYNYLKDPSGEAPPLLVLQELVIPEDRMSAVYDDDDDSDDDADDGTDIVNGLWKRRKYSHSGNNRTFLLDSQATVTGARIFFLTADELRRCGHAACLDVVHFIFPSLHRIDMTVTGAKAWSWSTFSSYGGNALDAVDGNRNSVVPVILQFGDLEVARAFVPGTHRNETYPATPVFKKFRGSLAGSELERIAPSPPSSPTTCFAAEREVPMTHLGERHLQPIISKLTYKRHFGMLDEIPLVDIDWNEKKDGAIWRGALTGMKRNGFRVVQQTSTGGGKANSKMEMCMNLQRCKLVYQHAASALVNASLVGVLTYQPNNLLREPVVPEVLQGVRLYGPRASYKEMLQYKAIIMLEGNDISSGLKWALYSNSVVLTQKAIYTSWAMEELLEPWVHFVPLADDLSDVEEKVRWVLEHDEQAQQIARAGSLWVSDLIYHPEAATDEAAILDETFWRYKQHFVHNPALTYERLLYNNNNRE